MISDYKYLEDQKHFYITIFLSTQEIGKNVKSGRKGPLQAGPSHQE